MKYALPRWKSLRKNGFAATKMSDIAARAGVSRPTLYLYFSNKEAIFKTLVQENIVPLIVGLGAGVDKYDGPARALLEQILRNIFAHMLNPKVAPILRMLITEGAQFPELTEFYKAELVDPGRKMLARVLEQGVRAGEFRKETATLDPRLLLAPALLGVIWDMLFGHLEKMDIQGLLDSHFEVIFRGISSP